MQFCTCSIVYISHGWWTIALDRSESLLAVDTLRSRGKFLFSREWWFFIPAKSRLPFASTGRIDLTSAPSSTSHVHLRPDKTLASFRSVCTNSGTPRYVLSRQSERWEEEMKSPGEASSFDISRERKILLFSVWRIQQVVFFINVGSKRAFRNFFIRVSETRFIFFAQCMNKSLRRSCMYVSSDDFSFLGLCARNTSWKNWVFDFKHLRCLDCYMTSWLLSWLAELVLYFK